MADFTKGEVSGRVRGRVKTLCLDMAALAQFEENTGQKAFKALEEMRGDDAGYATLRRLVRTAMLKHHPDATLAEAQTFIAKHAAKIRELLTKCLPEADGNEVEDAEPGNRGGAKK